MAIKTDTEINNQLVEIRDETAPEGNTRSRLYNAFKNIYDTVLSRINNILGTNQESFTIQRNSQNQNAGGITVLGFGTQSGGPVPAIGAKWVDNGNGVEIEGFFKCTNYTGTGSDVWEPLGGAPAFEAIAEDQYGTHPAFTSQAQLNAYLLGGTYTPPTVEPVTGATATPQSDTEILLTWTNPA